MTLAQTGQERDKSSTKCDHAVSTYHINSETDVFPGCAEVEIIINNSKSEENPSKDVHH